jgi:hypothetical protein
MKRLTLVLALILLLLLANYIEPEQATEDNLAPYKQSLLPAFQGDIASGRDPPLPHRAHLSGWREQRRQFATQWMMWYNEQR